MGEGGDRVASRPGVGMSLPAARIFQNSRLVTSYSFFFRKGAYI